ncbi:fungal-specific transcription factor domain-containing protein [Mycotypha africana]|uniref:fungal-specific transcription factor domain-containing protein n=1 Tax=Mycotypha africana TaxID=64632 RepID=UPI00230060D3|nr:fungal-specific transcription factor domain-containing protein [Mycotypha africana]KAI8982435.1 fungal-specific transcription factor domain-containing protein [Mycotypha africana]
MSASPALRESSSTSKQRVSKACDHCRRKKVKCDEANPICTNCKALELECTFEVVSKKRGPPKGYIEAIENRLYKLENFLAELAKGGDALSEDLLKELNAPLKTPTGNKIHTRPTRRAPRSDKNKVFFWQQDQAGKRKREALKEEQRQYNSSKSDFLQVSLNDRYDNLDVAAATDPCFYDEEDESKEQQRCRSKKQKTKNYGTAAAIGQLSMDESGHVRYLGKSSGYYLLQNSKMYQNGAFHFANYGKKRSSHLQCQKTATDPRVLPPKDLSEHLIQLYFKHFYPFLPLFYKQQISTTNAADNESVSTTPPLLLNAIYAVAARISPDIRVRSNSECSNTAGDVFFERAEKLLDESYDTPSISTVQALILLSIHQHGVMRTARAWLYSGIAFRMAQDLGLHRNCDTWNISPEERETRKRVFWCCYIVDRLASAMYGRAFTVEERDCDVPFPSIDDEEPIEVVTASEHSNTDIRLLDVFQNLIKIADILGHVLKNVYYVRSLQNTNDRHLDSILTTWNRKLHQWYDRLPNSLQLLLSDKEHDTRLLLSPVVISQLHMIYHTTMILLHRPFIPGPDQSLIPTTTMLPCSSICNLSADSIVNIIDDMHASKKLRYLMNFSVYYIFTAAVVFIQEVSFDSKNNSNQQQPFSKKNAYCQWKVKKCMLALDEIESTWPTASKRRQILAELSGLYATDNGSHQQVRELNMRLPTDFDRTASPVSQHQYSSPRQLQADALALPNSASISLPSSEQQQPSSPSSPQPPYQQQINDISHNVPFHVVRTERTIDLRYRLLQQQQQQQSPVIATPPTTHFGMELVIPDPFEVSKGTADHAMDPFAAPGIIPVPSRQRQQQQLEAFDPLATALWGMPDNVNGSNTIKTSGTLEENDWGTFMASNMQQQQQQAQTPFCKVFNNDSYYASHNSTSMLVDKQQTQHQISFRETNITTASNPLTFVHINNYDNNNNLIHQHFDRRKQMNNRAEKTSAALSTTTDISNAYYW